MNMINQYQTLLQTKKHASLRKHREVKYSKTAYGQLNIGRLSCRPLAATANTKALKETLKGFDLGEAIALAGCAFEAYLEPEVDQQYKDVTSNKTYTTYIDGDFLLNNYAGMMTIQLLRAANLPKADVFSDSDPYVTFTCGDSTAKSEVIYDNHFPEWNKVFKLYVSDKNEKLMIRVNDYDFYKSDDPLGYTFIRVSSLEENVDEEMTLDLVGDGGGGTITISVKFSPFKAEQLEKFVRPSVYIAPGSPEAAQNAVSRDFNMSNSTESSSDSTEEVTITPELWKALAMVAGQCAEELYDPIVFVENTKTDTQAWIYANKERKEVVVAFRGTEMVKWKDFVTDINLVPADLNAERVSTRSSVVNYLFKAADGPRVHTGFLKAYDSVRSRMVRLVESVVQGESGWKLYVTGHSLGGALAQLFSYEMCAIRTAKPDIAVEMYTYGAPRVGNKFFAEQFNEVVKYSWRVSNVKDIVPRIPRLMGYQHVDVGIQIDSSGSLEVSTANEGVFTEGAEVSETVRSLIEKLNEIDDNNEKAEAIKSELLSVELAILDSLTDGSAISEHMEDFYLNTLKQTVDVFLSDDEGEDEKR